MTVYFYSNKLINSQRQSSTQSHHVRYRNIKTLRVNAFQNKRRHTDSVMMTDHIRQYLQSYGINAPLKEVFVQPLPEQLRYLGVPVSGGHSFQTVAETIFNLEMEGYKELAYVLGYGLYRMPLEQAVIRLGDHYYDPVWRSNSVFYLAVMWELSTEELTEFVADKNRPPEFFDWLVLQNSSLKKSPGMGL